VRVAVCCDTLQCISVDFSEVHRCSVVHRIAVGFQCGAVWCSVLQCVTARHMLVSPLRVCVAACCSVLQHVAVCCSMLQCVTVDFSMVQCGAVWCIRISVCCGMTLGWFSILYVYDIWMGVRISHGMSHRTVERWIHMGWLRLVGSFAEYSLFCHKKRRWEAPSRWVYEYHMGCLIER